MKTVNDGFKFFSCFIEQGYILWMVEMNQSAVWGKWWNLDVKDYDSFSEMQYSYDEFIEQMLIKIRGNEDEVDLDDLNRYCPITYIMALIKSFINENEKNLELTAQILKLQNMQLDIYQLDWLIGEAQSEPERMFYEGAIANVLLNRYLPVIDILYYILNSNSNFPYR